MSKPQELVVGLSPWSQTVPDDHRVELRRAAFVPPAAPAAELTRVALERPIGFEAMRRALTPDDRVTVVIDPRLPHLAEMLAEVLRHLGDFGADRRFSTWVSKFALHETAIAVRRAQLDPGGWRQGSSRPG
jgi:hypothetical protein